MQVRSLGQEDLLEKEMATQLQYSCLENSMGRGAWHDTIHGATESRAEHFSVHIRKFKGEQKIETCCELRQGGHGMLMQICAIDSWKHNSRVSRSF